MLDLALGVESVVIVCTKISKRNIILEHMVNRYEHRVGNSDRGTVCPPPNNKSLILCGKEGICFLDSGFRTLNQGGFQGDVA